MFTVFMEAVERKYQENPEKYGGKPQAKSQPKLPPGAVIVTAKSGGAGFVCAADLRVKKVTPGGLSSAAGLKVGMQLAGYTAGGRRHAMGGVSWPAFKILCKQSPYPRVFTFVPTDNGAHKHQLSTVPIPEGLADRPARKAKDASKDEHSGAKAAEDAKAEQEEQQRIQHAFAEAQAKARRKEEEEAAAQAEAAAQMRAREEAKVKAEEQAAKAAAKAAEEAAAKAAKEAAAMAAKKAARAAEEAKRREAEAADQEKLAREARLKPSGPVNVYISPLM